ncbi:MAG: hypothetical protein HQK65_09710 [Desulfamplus sp.]|nr:hypothetical protein [Desulfamplus sp.]
MSSSLAVSDIGNLAAILSWKVTKGVYRFDPELLESLWDVKLDKEIPVDLIFENLPKYCCYIDLEGFQPAEDKSVIGFFTYLEHDANTGHREIRLAFVMTDQDTPYLTNFAFHVDESDTTIGSMVDASLEYSRKQVPKLFEGLNTSIISTSDKDCFDPNEKYSPFFSLILYICSAERDIITVSKPRKIKKTKNPKKQKKQLPIEYRVGSTIGKNIRKARSEYSKEGTDTGAGTKKSPHIRKAHYHLYWTGEGRKIPQLKFIYPVLVNIGEEPEMPIVKRVK